MTKTNILVALCLCINVLSCTKLESTNGNKASSNEDKGSFSIMPKELVEIAEQNGYEQVYDFYDGSDLINPPFVYGVGSGPEHESAAFWAQKDVGGARKYYLMFFYSKPSRKAHTCPDVFEWGLGTLGGLAIDEYIDFVPDEEFKFLNDLDKQVSGTPQSSKGILSYRVGIEVLFFCYDDEWMVRIRH